MTTSALLRPGFYPATGPVLAPGAPPMPATAPRPMPIGPGRDVVVVGMAEMRVSANPEEKLVTYALGSCLGIAVWDPVALVGGLLHVMLPAAAGAEPEKAQANPCMFVDSGLPLLFRECYRLGAQKLRMIVKVAGGSYAGPAPAKDHFQIGRRNLNALRSLLGHNGVPISAEDVGGLQLSRTMALDVGTGLVTLRVGGRDTPL